MQQDQGFGIEPKLDFDIDVDISPLLGTMAGPTLVSDRWYRLAQPRPGRDPALQAKADRMLRNATLNAQWSATARRSLDRRRAIRVPLLSRVQVRGGDHLVSTDISLSGMRASGTPTAPIMDVEFKVPGLPFPVDTRVEVMTFKKSNVIPLMGLRFINLERPYVEQIAAYVARRRQRSLANAA